MALLNLLHFSTYKLLILLNNVAFLIRNKLKNYIWLEWKILELNFIKKRNNLPR